MPHAGPTDWTDPFFGTEYTVYPNVDQGFNAVQSFSNGIGQSTCDQQYDLVFFCPKDGTPCLGFALFQPACAVLGAGVKELKICGDIVVEPAEAAKGNVEFIDSRGRYTGNSN